MRACSECGQSFQPRASFHRQCLACWKRAKDTELYSEGYLRGYDDGYDKGRKVGPFDGQLVRDLLVLVHPDHQPHERHELANDATARLLALRPERKAAA